MVAKERIAFVDKQLKNFKDSLEIYQEQTKSWYATLADEVNHKRNKPSLLGMERILKAGGSSTAVSMTDDNFTVVAQCPLKGPLLIESKFESLYDIPVGDIEVEVVAEDGSSTHKVKLDAQGKASWSGGVPGKRYIIRVHDEVTPAQIDTLFDSYKGLNSELESFYAKMDRA